LHLYKVFLALDLQEVFNNFLPQQCLALILRVLNLFVQPQGRWTELTSKITDTQIAHDRIIVRVLSILAAVTGPATNAAPEETKTNGSEEQHAVAAHDVGLTQASILHEAV